MGCIDEGSSHTIQTARAPCARSVQDCVLLSCWCLAQICCAGNSGTAHPACSADGETGRNRGSRPVRFAYQCRFKTAPPSRLDQIFHTDEVTVQHISSGCRPATTATLI